MAHEFNFTKLVLQPTSLCNINCSYCYLAERRANNKMAVDVARVVADSLSSSQFPLRTLWHGGEPLSCGKEHFKLLLNEFEELRQNGMVAHSLQTNATLINDEWCRILRDFDIQVGISIDGPEWANGNRLDFANRATHSRVLHGISCLKRNGIDFTIICVVGNDSLSRARELYEFFSGIGCIEVGFNIEQMQGVNQNTVHDTDGSVGAFWRNIYSAWAANPKIRVREIEKTLSWISNPSESRAGELRDMFPSIAHNGKVVVLSPEFLDAHSQDYADFEAGNVLARPLHEICEHAASLTYVKEFILGRKSCETGCDYFSFCKGGDASSKFFELGTTAGTETVSCRNSEQLLVDAVLSAL